MPEMKRLCGVPEHELPFGTRVALSDGIINGQLREVSPTDMRTDLLDIMCRNELSVDTRIEIGYKVLCYCEKMAEEHQDDKWHEVLPSAILALAIKGIALDQQISRLQQGRHSDQIGPH